MRASPSALAICCAAGHALFEASEPSSGTRIRGVSLMTRSAESAEAAADRASQTAARAQMDALRAVAHSIVQIDVGGVREVLARAIEPTESRGHESVNRWAQTAPVIAARVVIHKVGSERIPIEFVLEQMAQQHD